MVAEGSGPIALSHWQLKNCWPDESLAPVNPAIITRKNPITATTALAAHAMIFIQ